MPITYTFPRNSADQPSHGIPRLGDDTVSYRSPRRSKIGSIFPNIHVWHLGFLMIYGNSNGTSQRISYYDCPCDSSNPSKDRSTIFPTDTKGSGQTCLETITYCFGGLANGSQNCWICWLRLEQPVFSSTVCGKDDRIPATGVCCRHV